MTQAPTDAYAVTPSTYQFILSRSSSDRRTPSCTTTSPFWFLIGPVKMYSTVVFWVARGNPSPCHNHRLLGEQRGEEIFRPLPEFEALVGIQDQPLNECLRLLTTRFPNGFDG